MILKNIIQDADPDIIADIWNTWHAEYEKPYDKEKLKSALQHLIQTLTWTEQKNRRHSIRFHRDKPYGRQNDEPGCCNVQKIPRGNVYPEYQGHGTAAVHRRGTDRKTV